MLADDLFPAKKEVERGVRNYGVGLGFLNDGTCCSLRLCDGIAVVGRHWDQKPAGQLETRVGLELVRPPSAEVINSPEQGGSISLGQASPG